MKPTLHDFAKFVPVPRLTGSRWIINGGAYTVTGTYWKGYDMTDIELSAGGREYIWPLKKFNEVEKRLI